MMADWSCNGQFKMNDVVHIASVKLFPYSSGLPPTHPKALSHRAFCKVWQRKQSSKYVNIRIYIREEGGGNFLRLKVEESLKIEDVRTVADFPISVFIK